MEGQPNLPSGNATSHEDWIPESFDLVDDDDSFHWHHHPFLDSVEHATVAPFSNDSHFHNQMQPNVLHDTSIAFQEQLSHNAPPNAVINDDRCVTSEPLPTSTDDYICQQGSFQNHTHQLQQEFLHSRGQVYHPLPTTGNTTVLPSGFVSNNFLAIQDESAHKKLSGFIPQTMNLGGRLYNANMSPQQSQFNTNNKVHDIQPQLNLGNHKYGPFLGPAYAHVPVGYSYFHNTTDIRSPPIQCVTNDPNRMDQPDSINSTLASHNSNIPGLQWPNTSTQFITTGNVGSINLHHTMEYNPSAYASLFGNNNSDALLLYRAQNNILTAHHNALLLNRLGSTSGLVQPNHLVNQLSSTSPLKSEQHEDSQRDQHSHEIRMGNLLAPNNVPRQDPRTKPKALLQTKKRTEQQKINGEIIRRLIEAHGPMNIFLGRGAPFRDASGNKKLSRLVHDHLTDYVVADNKGKTAIRASIRQQLVNQGLKFYTISESGVFQGECCDDKKIDAKIGHALRDAPKKYGNLWFWKLDDVKDQDWKGFGKEGGKLEKGYLIYSQKPEDQYEFVEVNVDTVQGDKNHLVNLRTLKMAKVSDGNWDFVVRRGAGKATVKGRRKAILDADSGGANDASESGDATSYASNESTTRSQSQSNTAPATSPNSNVHVHQLAPISNIFFRLATTEEVEKFILYAFMKSCRARNVMNPPTNQEVGDIPGEVVDERNDQLPLSIHDGEVVDQRIDQLRLSIHDGPGSQDVASDTSEEIVDYSTTVPPPPNNSNEQAQNEKSRVDPQVFWIWRENRSRMEQHRFESIYGDPMQCWIRYERETSYAIESAYQSQEGVGRFRLSVHEVDFVLMRQTSLRSGYQRQLKRVILEDEAMANESGQYSSSAGNDPSDPEAVKVKTDDEQREVHRVASAARHDLKKELQSKTNDTTSSVVWVWRENRTRMKKHGPDSVFGDVQDCWIRYDKEMSHALETAHRAQGGLCQRSKVTSWYSASRRKWTVLPFKMKRLKQQHWTQSVAYQPLIHRLRCGMTVKIDRYKVSTVCSTCTY